MKNSVTQRNLKFAVVVLLALNVATIATIAYHLMDAKKEQVASSNSENGSPAYSGRYFRDRLNFSASQMDQFREINTTFRQTARAINTELASKRNSMFQAMQQPQADTIALNQLSAGIGLLHQNLKTETYKYYLGIRNICDSTQQNELNQMFSEFFIQENIPMSSGNGNQRNHYRKGNKN
jgi:Spy/CpxP family protein refolding chaperone